MNIDNGGIMSELTATTHLGETVKAGDRVAFTNSDGEFCSGSVLVDPFDDKKLYFWNRFFDVDNYKSLKKI